MMKVHEVAKRLNCGKSLVYELMANGALRYYALGTGQGGKRVSEEQLQEYLRSVERGGEHADAEDEEELTFIR